MYLKDLLELASKTFENLIRKMGDLTFCHIHCIHTFFSIFTISFLG